MTARSSQSGAMGSSLTLTLANIFIYVDDIFMTWNKSEEELRKLLDYVNTWHPNIKLDYKIAEPYLTPFISHHPQHVFINIIQTSLARAARYSSAFEAFNYEQSYIKLMLPYNGYPSTLIENEFHRYLSDYISASPVLPLIDNEKKFFQRRKKLLGQPTPRQSQVALGAATADIDNDQVDDETKQPNESPTKLDTTTIAN
ncbi:unnamed protein product [Rotaria magnacalcarata]|uniref:Helix-turn-helix domain-containing protein n=5 Tax=Rotaria magnacalcarata TaxID=392030 RepID=A0A818XKR7_9BILA|nr:unnamed protein product [Rotaria magnacalcarata]